MSYKGKFLIKDDCKPSRFLSYYAVNTCSFSAQRDSAIDFDSLKRAGNVLIAVTKIIPEYVKLEIIQK